MTIGLTWIILIIKRVMRTSSVVNRVDEGVVMFIPYPFAPFHDVVLISWFCVALYVVTNNTALWAFGGVVMVSSFAC